MRILSDFRQSKPYIDFLKDNGWEIIDIKDRNSLLSQYLFIWKFKYSNFSLIRSHRLNLPICLDRIEEIARTYKTISIRIEPNLMDNHSKIIHNQFLRYGYKVSDWSHMPTKTRIILLSKKSLDDVKREMKSRGRRNITKAINNGIRIINMCGMDVINNKNIFQALHKIIIENDIRIGLPIYPKKWLHDLLLRFDRKVLVLLGCLDNLIVSANIFFIFGDSIYYTLNGSTYRGRRKYAPSLAVWEALKYSLKSNIKIFDFDGVYDERLRQATNDWKGFTRFKESFGGEDRYLSLAYEKNYHRRISYLEKWKIKLFGSKFLPSIYPEAIFGCSPSGSYL